MKNITIFKASGEIIRNVLCPESMVEAQVKVGEQRIEGKFSSDRYYVDVVTMQPIEKPPKPDGDFEFDVVTKQWTQKYPTAEDVLAVRSRLLQQSDWTQLPDVPLPTKTAWATYRQALRDITLQAGYPQTIDWPPPPI